MQPASKPYFYLCFLAIISLNLILNVAYFIVEYVMTIPPDGSISANINFINKLLLFLLLLFLVLHFFWMKEKLIFYSLILFLFSNFIYQISIHYHETSFSNDYLTTVVLFEKTVFWTSVLVCLAIIYRDNRNRSLLTYFAFTLFAEKIIWWMFPHYSPSIIFTLYFFNLASWILFGIYIWINYKALIIPIFKHE